MLLSSVKQDCLATARLYGIVDLGYVAPGDIERTTAEMCAGGVDILQLRAKGFVDLAIEEFGNRIQPIASDLGTESSTTTPSWCPECGADGAHVGQDDIAVADARWRAGRAVAGEVPLPIIGKSTHSVAQAVGAAAEGADYIGFGPLFPRRRRRAARPSASRTSRACMVS